MIQITRAINSMRNRLGKFKEEEHIRRSRWGHVIAMGRRRAGFWQQMKRVIPDLIDFKYKSLAQVF